MMQNPKNPESRNTRRNAVLLWSLAACVVLLLAIVLIVWVIDLSGTPVPTDPVTTLLSETTDASGTADPETTEEIPHISTVPETTEATEPTVPPATDPPIPYVPVTTADTSISLPYRIPNTTLELQSVASYDGTYLEDSSDAPITQVAMLLLKNVGSEAVEYTEITMNYGDKTLHFVASAIKAGGTAVVQEAGKQSCAAGKLLSCQAEVATLAVLGMAADQVSVTDNGNNSLTVTNLTGQDIAVVRIFYKYYMEDLNTYVGGITYTAKITGLKANTSVTVSPNHYASSGSVVVMVRTYTEDVPTEEG